MDKQAIFAKLLADNEAVANTANENMWDNVKARYHLGNNYLQMLLKNTLGSDDYFHPKAMAEAAQDSPNVGALALRHGIEREKRQYATDPDGSIEDLRINLEGYNLGLKNPNASSKILLQDRKPKGMTDFSAKDLLNLPTVGGKYLKKKGYSYD